MSQIPCSRRQVTASRQEADRDGVEVPTTMEEYCMKPKSGSGGGQLGSGGGSGAGGGSHDIGSMDMDDLYDDDDCYDMDDDDEEEEDEEDDGGVEEVKGHLKKSPSIDNRYRIVMF